MAVDICKAPEFWMFLIKFSFSEHTGVHYTASSFVNEVKVLLLVTYTFQWAY